MHDTAALINAIAHEGNPVRLSSASFKGNIQVRYEDGHTNSFRCSEGITTPEGQHIQNTALIAAFPHADTAALFC